MSLVIRLKIKGSRNRLTYGIVVAEKRSKRDGKVVAEIGFYNPLVKPPVLKIDNALMEEWQKKGAQLSTGLKKILNNQAV